MDYNSLIAILLGGLGSLVLWLILGPIMTGYGFKKLVKKAIDGDEKSLEVFMNVGQLLMVWATQTQMHTGKKIKKESDNLNADGKPIIIEVDEILTPIQMLSQAIGTYAWKRAAGSVSGVKSQMGRMFQEELAASGQGLSPAALSALARGKLGPAISEAILPLILDKLKQKNKGGQGDTGAQGGW